MHQCLSERGKHMSKKFYVTTPIYYPSGQLHLGHAYTTTLADIMKRYKQRQGYEVFFLTGSDEHGQKIAKKAAEFKMSPKAYLDERVDQFKDLWKKLHIDYDYFIRTTDENHVQAVQKIFEALETKGLIYKGHYEGLYCVSCEEFLTPEQIDETGCCKISQNKPEKLTEETYFLKVSAFQDFIEDLLKTDFLKPDYRRSEMLKNFVEPGLKDLSITRTSFDWGIPIIGDEKHVVYVWLDALSNYLTALGYFQTDKTQFEKFWAEDTEILQFVGKEIIRFHSIYWPVLLKSLDLRLPNTLLAHGWIMNKNTKMSKSLGNVIDPLVLINEFGADALRFYLAHDLPTERDGNFSGPLFIESFNVNLANNVGNLISRVNKMITQYSNGKLLNLKNVDLEMIDLGHQTIDKYQKLMDNYQISEAINVVLDLGVALNKYIENEEPWVLDRDGYQEELEKVLVTLQRNLIIMTYLLEPVLVETTPEMFKQLGADKIVWDPEKLKTFSHLHLDKLPERKILFKRIKDHQFLEN
ncbi:methionine--tRNA ligase [Entomoplasma freundtii]|uniref:methionine--tRNA ligase n=1 Tax=Entomoplasma freundtii TaxID=74700 RepID=UPI0022B7B8BE|nr:methionine--tRNA ligase [Entomoplasma freundtii]